MNKLTIVIPNRSRNLQIVSRSLSSLNEQWIDGVKIVVVDYGSEPEYQTDLQKLITEFNNIDLKLCATHGQLWNKSKCINLILNTCISTHLMVCDMDMIWHPQALQQVLKDTSDSVNYYQVGFLDQNTTATYSDYSTALESFKSDPEATGITVFPVKALKEINGFDEFYHGWGSEDTDAHVRCKHAGYEIRFRESEILFKHQWHEKAYRHLNTIAPLHTGLERVNQEYLKQTKLLKRIKANQNFEKGQLTNLTTASDPKLINVSTLKSELKAMLHSLSETSGYYVIEISIKEKSLKEKLKAVKQPEKYSAFTIEEANNLILEWIISQHRNCVYRYNFNHDKILLTIDLHP